MEDQENPVIEPKKNGGKKAAETGIKTDISTSADGKTIVNVQIPPAAQTVGYWDHAIKNGLILTGTGAATAFLGGLAGYGGYRLGCKMFGVGV